MDKEDIEMLKFAVACVIIALLFIAMVGLVILPPAVQRIATIMGWG